jgi:hypothetical protein
VIYYCCDRLRRSAVEGSSLNGIDFLEVLDRDAPTPAERQRTLFVHFVNAPAPALTPTNFRIEGGERVRGINVIGVSLDAADNHVLDVKLDQPGDFSVYTLRIVQNELHSQAPADIDPPLASVDFSFKVECPTDFDCRPLLICPPGLEVSPEIDYLAKDYESFRQLMLDRMAAVAPRWKERHSADLGVTLVELMAFVGDYLSYQQDATATEAYLGTARRRISVRRHARLVDYAMHDGCNARAWVQLQVDSDVVRLAPTAPAPVPKGTSLCTALFGQGPVITDPALLAKADEVFETTHDIDGLYRDHNRIDFYTWSDQECCLATGATAATLAGHLPHLGAGDVLVFEEVVGPLTGAKEDADQAHRWAVRLTRVQAFDASSNPLTDPLTADPITEIEWAVGDALPFPLCMSSRTDEDHGKRLVPKVSVARGNIVLVDHGMTVAPEPLGTVPEPRLFYPQSRAACDRGDREALPPRFRPALKHGPITQAAPLTIAKPRTPPLPPPPSSVSLISDPHAALPAITLLSELHAEPAVAWHPRLDLLTDGPADPVFLAEMEADGTAYLRFGDGQHGSRPESKTVFTATYRVGVGVAGNVGREAIAHVLSHIAQITAVRNPMPAAGGVEPESMEDVRQRAPSAFRTQERAVTEPDYAEVAQRHAGVQRAAASFRWTGSWHTVFLTLDRLGGELVDANFRGDVRDFVERFRMAGYDLDVDAPRFVSLDVQMEVCVKPDYFRSEVRAALLEVFSNRMLPDGSLGVFHPDNFSFGETVYLSRLYAAAQAVDGVESVDVKVFGRLGVTDPKPLAAGELLLNRLEIARLDNDPNFPERGVFRLEMRGGK